MLSAYLTCDYKNEICRDHRAEQLVSVQICALRCDCVIERAVSNEEQNETREDAMNDALQELPLIKEQVYVS